jgi:hypothetical protein
MDRKPGAEGADLAGDREPADARIEDQDTAPGGGRLERIGRSFRHDRESKRIPARRNPGAGAA